MKPRRFIPVMLAALTLLAFHAVHQAEFLNLDDDRYITHHPRVPQGLTWGNLAWAFTSFEQANWHPLTWLSFMLDATLWGVSPRAFHLVNLAAHTANVLLVYGLLARLTGLTWRPAIAAALWAVHPLRVESVAWVAERKDVMAMLFGLLAMRAYAASAPSGPAGVWKAAGWMAASLMFKPMFVVLPVLLLALDFWPRGRLDLSGRGAAARSLSLRTAEKWPLITLSAAISAVAIVSQRLGGAAATLQEIGVSERLANACIGVFRYLIKHFWPTDLAAVYPYNDMASIPLAIACGAGGVAATAMAWRWRDRRPAIFVGWMWFLVALLPVIGLVHIGTQSIANRYTYLPGVGLMLLLAWSLPQRWFEPGHGRVALIGAVVAIAALLAVLTHQQTLIWSRSLSLFEYTLRVAPKDNWLAHLNLATALVHERRFDPAISHFEQAIAIRPDRLEARSNLANLLSSMGRYDQALDHYRIALQQNSNQAMVLSNMGLLLRLKGRPEQALAVLEQAAKMTPPQPEALNNYASVLADAGRTDEAIAMYRRALELYPVLPEAMANLAAELGRRGEYPEAIAWLERALQMKPDYVNARMLLGATLGQAGRREQGVAHLQRALTIDPDFAPAWYNLGNLHLAAGDPVAAADCLLRAAQLQPDNVDTLAALARVLWMLGRNDQALAALVQARRLDPRRADLIELWKAMTGAAPPDVLPAPSPSSPP